MAGTTVAFGPGKADLLQAIVETQSVRQAALHLHMSYMRAWSLIRVMNKAFKRPLVETLRGGQGGGGARLTPTGKRVLILYRDMQLKALDAAAPSWSRIRRMLK